MNCDKSEHAPAPTTLANGAAAPTAAECTDRHDGDGEKVVDDEFLKIVNIYQHSNNAYLLLLQ